MTEPCFISICIPAYEKPAALNRLLESIAVQDFKNFEVVITDDSKTDAVEETVAAYKDKFILRYYRNMSPLGMGKNWNSCISKASAPWIKMMHDDDWFAGEGALEKFAAKATGGTADFIFSASYQVYADNNSTVIESFNNIDKKLVEGLPMSLFFKNTIGSPSVTMFKKDASVVFDDSFRWVIDIDFYLFYLQQHKNVYAYTDDPLVCITKDDAQVSASCYKNPLVEIPEYLGMLLKVNPQVHLQNKYAFYCVWELVRKFSITEKSQLLVGGNKIIPEKIDAVINYQKRIPRLILKQPPWNKRLMQRAFNKFKI